MPSLKTPVLDNLFFDRYDETTGTLSDPVVTLKQVSTAIGKWGASLSDRNPANFLKDVVRSPTRNDNFPASVVAKGWTVRQDPGAGRCFRFVQLPAGQTTAFLNNEPDPSLVAAPHEVQSLSLPPVSRQFGKPHETWLTHVVTNLAVLHTHIALHSPLEFIGLELLQSNVGLGDAEVDAVYLGTLADASHLLLSCEMKGPREVLDEHQIERGASRVAATSSVAAAVVPVGVKALRGELVWIVEFDTSFPPVAQVSEGVYRLVPPVPGIG